MQFIELLPDTLVNMAHVTDVKIYRNEDRTIKSYRVWFTRSSEQTNEPAFYDVNYAQATGLRKFFGEQNIHIS